MDLEMKQRLKEVRFSFLMLYGIALAVAIVGRVGLAVMDLNGILTYDYIAASTGTLLNQICSALTGPALFGFMFVAALALTCSAAGTALYGYWFAHGTSALKSPLRALLYGAATTVASLVCAIIPASGVMSAVQIASMRTKLHMDVGVAVMGVAFFVAIATLLAAAALVVCACFARAKSVRRAGVNLLAAALLCGLVVSVLTAFTFATVNVATLDGWASATWFGIDTIVNIVMLTAAALLSRKPMNAAEAG